MEGGQSGTYLRLTKASSGLRLSVAKTYRDYAGPGFDPRWGSKFS